MKGAMPKKKKIPKTKVKLNISKSKTSTKASVGKKSRSAKVSVSSKVASEFQWRERRLKDIPFVDRHPTPETAKKYNDTLPLPFGGEVKKDAMRDHGLFH